MATIDSNIAMGYRPIQIENPLNQLAAVSQIQANQQGQQLNALKIKETERELGENEEIRNYLAGANLNTPEGRAGLRRFGKTGLAYEKILAEQEKTSLERTKLSGEISKQQTERNNQRLRDLSRNPSNANIQAHFEDFELDNPNDARKIEDARRRRDYLLSADMPTRNAYLSSIGATAGELKPVIKDRDIGGSIIPTVLDPYTGLPISTGKPIAKTATPGELLIDKRARDRLDAEINSTGDFSPASLDLAANLLIQTGQLPNLGMGRNAAALKTRIYNRATELYNNPAGAAPSVNPPGVAPNANAPAGANAPVPFNAAAMADQIVSSKIDVATKTKAAKDFSTGIQGRQVTAFNTAIDHLATMDKLSDALQNNDFKAFNYLGNIVAKQTGQPAPVNFDTAKQIVTAEIIKAVVASGGGVRERQEAEANFATANSPAQLKGVINTYKQLLGGQLNSLGLQYENTTGRTDFDKKLTSEAKSEYKKIREQHNASGLPPGVGANWQLMQDGKGNKAYVNPANPKEIIEVK
jgi:hypothetical protein